jgi:hypothetical protein
MSNIDLKQMVEDNFGIYAGMVIQKRALVDARDCLKPSARQLMYAQYIDKIDWKHKYQSSLKSVGSGTAHFYVHGDSSAYGVLIRMGKTFAMRYVLEDVKGNAGTMTKNGNEAQARYTEMKLAPVCANLFENIEKNTVSWLDNYDNTVKFLRLVSQDDGLNIGLRHISVSTCGIVDKIDQLSNEGLPITLSISLHAYDNEVRSSIMPINNKYSIEQLLSSCNSYFDKTGRRISFEYTLIAGKNDTQEGAVALAKILKKYIKGPCHVNLIPLNEVKETKLESSKNANTFKNKLISLGINATVRRRLGSDINASCGQLRRKAKEDSEVK